jgi:hypothetical protein
MHKKIDLYRVHRNERGRITRTEYVCSTNWSRTIREAIARFHEINGADAIIGDNAVPYGAEMKGQFA